MRDKEYIDTILSHTNNLKEKEYSVLIFGAARASWYIIKVLEHFGVTINGIIDNDVNKHGTYSNYPVNSLAEMGKCFPNSVVYLGLFSPITAEIVASQMQQFSFIEIHFIMEAVLFTYFTKVASRNCDNILFANNVHNLFENYHESVNKYGYNKKGLFISPSVTVYVTQKCSLRCKDCGSLIPYYRSPKNFSVEQIVETIKQYAFAFDIVPEMSFSGGEPFLHPQFHKICNEVSKISNIIFINFTTNGTIIPTEKKLEQLSLCGADVHQSDYGKLSKKQSELFELCNKHNIYCDINFVNSNKMWTPKPEFKKRNRGAALNNKYYKECVRSNRYCHQLMVGELYKCPASLNGTQLELLPKITNDIVKLFVNGDHQTKNRVRKFILRANAIGACDYCNLPETGFVEPALQLQTTHSKEANS